MKRYRSAYLAAMLAPLIAAWLPACSANDRNAEAAPATGQTTNLDSTAAATPTPLDPAAIPKFVNQLVKPPTFVPLLLPGAGGQVVTRYDVTALAIRQQLLPPGFPSTKVYAYGGLVEDDGDASTLRISFSTPGPTFEATRGKDIFVHYHNALLGPHIFPVDPTLMVANPNGIQTPTPPFQPFPPGYPLAQAPIPIVTHLHGGVTPSESDGFPRAWFTLGQGITGPAFTTTTFHYFNAQLATTLWYHDHTIGMTRLNVAAGLEGTYLIRETQDPIAKLLPSGRFEIPLMLTDRSFNTDGSIAFTQVGNNPDIHPYWDPEYFGNVIVVNGKAWPNLNVDRRQYRFRIVNASNARFYNLKLSNGMSFVQIGGDGSYLPAAATLTEALVAPAERADILVDFSTLAPGTKVVLTTDAPAPFPGGDLPDPATTGQIMQFTVR